MNEMKRRLPTENSFGTDRFRLPHAILLFAGLAAALWMYRGAFRCYFIQDDFAWLVLSRFHSFGDWLHCLIRFNPAGTYRPLSQETFFWAAQKMFGMQPAGFHIIVIAVHIIAALLLFRLLRRFVSAPAAIAGAFIYAVHSVHGVSLFWISAFPEPLAMVFLLASILFFIRFDRLDKRSAYALSLVSMALGFMSKESVLTLPLILAAYCFLWARSRLRYTWPYFAASAAYMLLRIIGGVHWSPYTLDFGRQTLNELAAYVSWMGGFSDTMVRIKFGWKLPESYIWIAGGFLVFLAILLFISRNKRVAVFGLLWMAFALQPVLYFSNHSYAYYLAPALAGFSIVLASAFSTLPDSTGLKRNVFTVVTACAFFVFSYLTVRSEGDWWNQRTAAEREFVAQLLAADQKVPAGATAYILGFGQSEFEKLENGGVFKAFNLQRSKFKLLLPDLDPELPATLNTIAGGGETGRVYCFAYSAGKLVDQTAAFRADPFKLVPQRSVRFDEVPGVAIEAKPSTVIRGKDTFTLRLINLDAPVIDLLYTIDGQIMPPLLGWRLDSAHSASVFADMTTPEGAYRFLAVRNSSVKDAPWIKLSARLTVR